MKLLLDTDVIINHLKQIKQLVVEDKSEISVSVISLAELLYGINKSPNPAHDRQVLNDFIITLSVSIVDVTKEVVESFSKVKVALEQKGQRLADFDLLIAVTALEHDLTLVTANRRHFSRIPDLKLAK